jgi:predicted O-methyltransferase YrrM
VAITDIHGDSFRAAVAKLQVPGMGTELVAPILSMLIQFARPRRVLEVGMGYTTPFLAAALADVEHRVRAEAEALAGKTKAYLDADIALDEQWLNAEPALLAPGFYQDPYRATLVAVDNLSIEDSSAPAVQGVLDDLGLLDRVTIVNADLHDCRELLPEDFAPIDLAWVDAWECLYFFDHFWDLINPDGGLVVMHYLMTYPEGETVLDYLAKVQRIRPGELEILNLLEPHKLAQNSLTVLRRTTAGKARSYSEPGGDLAYDEIREEAKEVSSRNSASDL